MGGRIMLATNAALGTWRRVFDSPETVQGGKAFNRAAYFRLLWSFYANDIFEDRYIWGFYRAQFGLYRNIRQIYNPTRRLVDLYASTIYPGVLSEDGKRLPEGVALAVPLAADTPPELVSAIGQFWNWSNFQAQKSVLVRYGAICGSVLVELVDDIKARKVTSHVVWPGLIQDLVLDATGNVKEYILRYLATDDRGFQYEYRKDVDAKSIRFYRDGDPFDYGEGAAYPNPYGFVPAVWVKHTDIGSDFGLPAIHGTLGKVDELNSLSAHVHDQIHKIIASPTVFWSDGRVGNLNGKQAPDPAGAGVVGKRGPTDDFVDIDTDRESLLYLRGPQGGHVESLAGNLPLRDTLAYIQQLIGEIEQDHPELTLYKELRAMSQVTGPAASRLVGDAAGLIAEAAANYDQQLIKLFQMGVAIAGWRLNNGDWGLTDRQREKFAPFDLDSYIRGDLDFFISPRPLVPQTRREQLDAERAELALQADRLALMSLQATGGVPATPTGPGAPGAPTTAVTAGPTALASMIQKVADRQNAKELEGPQQKG